MGLNLTQKIIAEHLVSGEMAAGEEIAIRVDQTLTQDATGTMACLQFEALGIPRVKTKLSVSYVDHNMTQPSFENADDHRFLQSFAAKYGLHFSRPGNGICHQLHLERFAMPGQVLLGSDSHTPTCGGLGMLAIGCGGLDVAAAMAGMPYYLPMPRVVLIRLIGRLQPWVAAKDVILELLRRLSVRGGLGRVIEFGGPGAATLSVTQRATITNMCAELGATSAIFPSDEQTHAWLRAQRRARAWRPLAADTDANYDEVVEIDLSSLEPLVARPYSPDNVVPVGAVEGIKLAQAVVGSCTGSSLADLSMVAAIMKGEKLPPSLSMAATPGTRQVYAMLARSGALEDLIQSGVRILELACGPCVGMSFAPPTGGVSLRSMNRNFPGRSGTPNDQVYLASAEVVAASALRGEITDPRRLGEPPQLRMPARFLTDDAMIMPPSADPEAVEVLRGPNIKPLPLAEPLPDTLRGRVLLKVGDNITTDHIMPAGARILPLRSNIPAIAEHVFERLDPSFVSRAKEAGGGLVVGGENYGQGSSREHAALAPMFLGVKAVLARSFARIHWANLVNFGILPLTFTQGEDYTTLEQGDEVELSQVRAALRQGKRLVVGNLTKNRQFEVAHSLSPRQVEILLVGGLLNYIKAQW